MTKTKAVKGTMKFLLVVACWTGLGLMAFAQQPPKFVSVKMPGSIGTEPLSINDSGDVTGWYFSNANLPSEGFIRHANGQYSTFEVPGSYGTAPVSINARGDVTGGWNIIEDGYAISQGFMRDRWGVFTTFEVPGSTAVVPVQINASGTVVGWYSAASDFGLPYYGFTRSPNGVVTTFNVPGAPYTMFTGINDAGEIIGMSGNGATPYFSLLNGVLTPLNILPESINQAGDIVGLYAPDAPQDGLVQWHNGDATVFTVPGAAWTGDYHINNQGKVMGEYQMGSPDACATCVGFIYSPTGVPITSFDPNSTSTTNTITTGFNNSNVVTGYYYAGPPYITPLGFLYFAVGH